MNESPAGSNEWIQPAFALTPQAVFTFSETRGCDLEKLLRNKDIPPGRRGVRVFEAPLSSIPRLQVGWGGEGSTDVRGTSAPRGRAPAPRSGERTLQADGSPAGLFVVVTELFWGKALKRGCALLPRNFSISWWCSLLSETWPWRIDPLTFDSRKKALPCTKGWCDQAA